MTKTTFYAKVCGYLEASKRSISIMRIAMIGQKGIPIKFGGVERHVESLAVRLGSTGHQVTVYTRAWYGRSNPNFSVGVRSIVVPTIKTKNLDAIVHTFIATLHAIFTGTDIIHYHGVGPSLMSWLPRLLAPRIKVVSTFHCIDRKHQKWGLFARLMLKLGERFACTFPHKTIVVSKTLQSYCDNLYPNRTEYIPNGITEPEAVVEDDGTLERYGLKPNGYLLMVSRLVRHKGAHYLIEAYKNLKKRRLVGDLKLVFVGDSAFTNDYVAEIKKMASDDSDIIFTGSLQGAPHDRLFRNSYAFILPSESEGLPIVILEAMSYGKTVLASDIPENVEVTRTHGINFRNTDVCDLEDKLTFLITNPQLVVRKGAGAKEFVVENYHWDDVARLVDSVYHGLRPQAEPVEELVAQIPINSFKN